MLPYLPLHEGHRCQVGGREVGTQLRARREPRWPGIEAPGCTLAS